MASQVVYEKIRKIMKKEFICYGIVKETYF